MGACSGKPRAEGFDSENESIKDENSKEVASVQNGSTYTMQNNQDHALGDLLKTDIKEINLNQTATIRDGYMKFDEPASAVTRETVVNIKGGDSRFDGKVLSTSRMEENAAFLKGPSPRRTEFPAADNAAELLKLCEKSRKEECSGLNFLISTFENTETPDRKDSQRDHYSLSGSMHSIHGLFSGNSTESIAIAPSIENITYCNGCYCVPAATRVNHGGNILNGLENVDIQERSNNIVQCKEQNPTDSLYTISVSKECSTKIHTDSNEPKHPNTQVDVSRSSSSESAANELIESSKPDATDYAKSYTAGRPPRLLQKLLAIDPVQHIRNKSDIMSDIDLMLEKLASEFERQEKLSSITL